MHTHTAYTYIHVHTLVLFISFCLFLFTYLFYFYFFRGWELDNPIYFFYSFHGNNNRLLRHESLLSAVNPSFHPAFNFLVDTLTVVLDITKNYNDNRKRGQIGVPKVYYFPSIKPSQRKKYVYYIDPLIKKKISFPFHFIFHLFYFLFLFLPFLCLRWI